MKLTILRFLPPDRPQAGILFVNDVPRFLTLEPPWRLNVADKPPASASCIPTGEYHCTVARHVKFGATGQFEPVTLRVDNVPGRSGIIFHRGNAAKHTRGCILVGTFFGDHANVAEVEVRNSQVAMSTLMNWYFTVPGVTECHLEIRHISHPMATN